MHSICINVHIMHASPRKPAFHASRPPSTRGAFSRSQIAEERAREMEYGVRMVLFLSGTTFATCVTPPKQLYGPKFYLGYMNKQ